MHEATFRLSGAGAFAQLTAERDVRIALWCNDHCDLMRVRSASGEIDRVLARIDDVTGIDDALVEDGDATVITNRCVKECEGTTVDASLDAHGCLLVPPLRYEEGARLCRVLALEGDRLTNCYRDLLKTFDVTVDAKRELETVSADDRPFPFEAPVPSLSRRQRQVFTMAFERGYYELPRETTMVEIADDLGIDRRTVEEHRRRAERKLLESVVEQYLA